MRALCPQEYAGYTMVVTPCTRCAMWRRGACGVETGAEGFPVVPEDEVPACPIQDTCQHQIQRGARPCVVRARGLVCASALATEMPYDEAMMRSEVFHADFAELACKLS